MRIVRIVIMFAAGCAGTPTSAPESAPTPEPAPSGAAQTEGQAPAQPAAPGVPIPNARTPQPGLLTGGQPTPEHLEQAAAAGYGTVISLRTPGEPGSEGEGDRVGALGMRYISIPVGGADDLTEDNARALAAALAEAEGPVLLHCGSGNRAGALLALKAHVVDGLDADAALDLGTRAGLTTLRPAVADRLAR